MNESLNRVAVLGAGTMGQQIAGHCLISGRDTRLFDVRPLEGLDRRIIERLAELAADPAEQQRRRSLLETIRIVSDPDHAARDADLVIECIPEDLPAKRRVLFQFSRLCPEHTIFTTNTSTFLPSQMVRTVRRPDLFAAMHFFPGCQVGELMGHEGTAPETIERLKTFLEDIGHTAVVCRAESSGALFNALLIPWLGAALSVVSGGLADPADVDRLWKTVTGSRRGPFELMDDIGLDTALAITRNLLQGTGDPELNRRMQLLKQYVDQGMLGVKTGRGFYVHPDPEPVTEVGSSGGRLSVPRPTEVPSGSWPIFDSLRRIDSETFEIDITLDGRHDAFLADHQFKGSPLLPGAAAVELFCQAVAFGTGRPVSDVYDLSFVNGLRCLRNDSERATICVRRNGDSWMCELKHEFRQRSGRILDPARLCASATIVTGPPNEKPSAAVFGRAGRWHSVRYLPDRTVVLGASMQCLRRLAFGADSYASGEIVAGYNEADDPDRIPAERHRAVSLIDAAFVACNFVTQHRLGNALQLPVSVRRVHRGRIPSAGTVCHIHSECLHLDERTSEYAFTVVADGQTVLQVDGYRCHVITGDSIAVLEPTGAV